MSFNSVIVFSDTSAELFCDKFSLTMLHSDSLTSVELFSDKCLCKMISFDSSSSLTLTFKTKVGSQKYKKARYAIRNISEKDLSNIIKEFEKIGKLPYEKKRPKHEPTDSYFHLARQLAKCMMRSDNLNWDNHDGYTEMNAPSLKVNVRDEEESKEII